MESRARFESRRRSTPPLTRQSTSRKSRGLARGGNSPERVRAVLLALACTVVPADEEMAIDAGLMRALTDRAGLSLSDSFCLALCRCLRPPPVADPDRHWMLIAGDVGVKVEVIR
jgi:PIN domain nuclease of toxin-antitoxin system